MTDYDTLSAALKANPDDDVAVRALIDLYADLPGQSITSAVRHVGRYLDSLFNAKAMADALALKENDADWWDYLLMLLMDEVDFRQGDNPEVHLVTGDQEPSLKRSRRKLNGQVYWHATITVGAGYLMELDYEERDRLRREHVEEEQYEYLR